jgi:hypothetical protein
MRIEEAVRRLREAWARVKAPTPWFHPRKFKKGRLVTWGDRQPRNGDRGGDR